jgi:hypothetical protein
MQPNADDLTDLERRLVACHPTAAGLDADAMLFAAGQAAAHPRRPRIVWPAIACGFAFLSAILGAGLMRERSERLELADRLNRPAAVAAETPKTADAPSSPPGPDSYVAIRHLVEQDADAWLARSDRTAGPALASPDGPQILHAWPVNSADLKP